MQMSEMVHSQYFPAAVLALLFAGSETNIIPTPRASVIEQQLTEDFAAKEKRLGDLETRLVRTEDRLSHVAAETNNLEISVGEVRGLLHIIDTNQARMDQKLDDFAAQMVSAVDRIHSQLERIER